MPYAYIQIGYAIYGIGETKEDAILDAKPYLEPDEILVSTPVGERVIGSMVLVECTEELRYAVNQRGYDVPFDINEHGVAYLL